MSASVRVTIGGAAIICWAALSGCAAVPAPHLQQIDRHHDRHPSDAAWLERDPVGYLRDCLLRSRQYSQYSLVLYRQERLGFIPTLQQPEHIRVLYRAEPLSIKMTWLEPDSESAEILYVAGQHGGHMLLLPRRGLFGLPPTTTPLDLQTPVLWGKAKRPITEFGLARTLERTLEAITRVGPDPPASVRYLHLKSLEQLDQPVHHVQIDYPPGSATKHQRQDLFIGAETRLPAGTFLWLPDGHLDAAYLYTELDLSIDLADEDFSITDRRLRTDPKPPTSQ